MVSYVVCEFHGTEAKFTSLLHVWVCFFKVAIAWMPITCYIILGLVKSCAQISLTGGTWAQGDGKSGIPQLKKTPRESQSWDGFLGFLEQLLPKGLICSANAWLRKHWSYIALATCKRCQWPPNMTWYLCSCDMVCPYPNWIIWPVVCSCTDCALPVIVSPEVQWQEASGTIGVCQGLLYQFLTHLHPCDVCQLLWSELFQACLLNWQWLTLIASTQGFPVIRELLGPV